MLVAASPVFAQAQPPDADTEARDTLPAPTATSALAPSDDLLGAAGLRAIGDARIEALAATGNDATHQAQARASDRVHGVGVELTGSALTSDMLGARTAAAARIEHGSEHDRLRLVGDYAGEQIGLTRQSFATDMHTAGYGAAWTAWRSAGRFELQAFGEQQTLHDTRATGALDLDGSAYRARGSFASRRVQAFGLDHELGGDVDVMQATGISTMADDPDMLAMNLVPRTKRGRHRFLNVYLHDTIRVIESLDVHGGFVFEHWRWLTNIAPIYAHDFGEGMDAGTGEVINELFGPQFGAVVRATPELALTATGYRKLRTPTWQQLMRPVQNGEVLTGASDDLHAATVTGGEVGPVLATHGLEARAVVYYNEIDAPIEAVTVADNLREIQNLGHAREAGVEAGAQWRIAKPWLAGIGYQYAATRVTDGGAHPELAGRELAQTPRHRATAVLSFDEPKLVTLTGAVRYVDRHYEDDRNTIAVAPYATVDAMAARKLVRGLAGFVAVENVFDRRYVANQAGVDVIGAPRLVQVGLRIDSARW